jgi:hypothetical protein
MIDGTKKRVDVRELIAGYKELDIVKTVWFD